MKQVFSSACCAAALLLVVSPAHALHRHRPATSKATKTSTASSKQSSRKTTKATGPRSMDDARATEIQKALIRAGYLSGEPSGHWDSTSQAAMVKLQGDNGWQTKMVPDSRALIKLGLGPHAEDASETASAVDSPQGTD